MKRFFLKTWKFLTNDIVLFVVVFIVLSFSYDYDKTSFIPPQGLHQWRQCVGAAYAMNYYNYDLDITQPRIYCYISQGGDSDKTIAECPIIYYFIAVLYKVFGNNDAIFRIVNALILFIGLFYLFKTARLFLEDKFWSLLLAVFLFTSPTLVYYGNNFLPDTSAFGLAFIAIYFVARYAKEKKIKYLYIAALVFAIAGLFKITSLLSYLAISGTYIIMWFFSAQFRRINKLAPVIIPTLIPVLIVLIWYYFVSYYNRVYGGTISPVEIRPIWILDANTIDITWNRIKNEWIYSYFHIYFHYLALALFITTLVFINKANRFISLLTLLTFIGGAGFFFLFFRSLHHHDYYLINVFILPVLILFNSFLLLKKYIPFLFKAYILKLGAIFLVIHFVQHAQIEVDYKFNGFYNNSHRKWYYGYVDLEKYNRNLGIKQNDKVISLPDGSMNISLYLMNQPGYTGYGFANLKDSSRMDFLIERGAKYLFISDTNLFYGDHNKYLQPYLKNKIGEHKNISIFDLREINTK